MSADHSSRAHALLSASGSHRWLACTPSAQLEAQFPGTTSEAAREGTLAHELCELKLRRYITAMTPAEKRKHTAEVNAIKKKELYQPEMDGHTDAYVDTIKAIALGFKEKPHIVVEQRLDLTEWIPDGFGTADCILVSGSVLQVVDFKYGKGVPVSAEHNPQMMLYALGAYAAYSMLYGISTVRMTIVQPRLSVEADTWETSIDDLLSFGDVVKVKAALAIKGEGKYNPGPEQCRFCRAKAQCRARAQENVRLAFFTDRKPPLISNDEVGEFLRQGVDVEKWLKDLQGYALSECLAGREIAGWKAVEGRGSRDWTDQDKAFEELEKAGTPQQMLYETLPLSLAKIEKMLGKKAFEEAVGAFVIKQPGKPALVPETDKRPAVTNIISADEAFKEAIE